MPRPSPAAHPPGACEWEPTLLVPAHPVPCLPPGPKGQQDNGWDHSTAAIALSGSAPASDQPPDVLCLGSVTRVLHPMSPRAEGDGPGPLHPCAWLCPVPAVLRVCLHRSDDAGSHTSALLLQCSLPRLGPSSCSASCMLGCRQKHPLPPWSFLAPSSLSVPPVGSSCAIVGWGWG